MKRLYNITLSCLLLSYCNASESSLLTSSLMVPVNLSKHATLFLFKTTARSIGFFALPIVYTGTGIVVTVGASGYVINKHGHKLKPFIQNSLYNILVACKNYLWQPNALPDILKHMQGMDQQIQVIPNTLGQIQTIGQETHDNVSSFVIFAQPTLEQIASNSGSTALILTQNIQPDVQNIKNYQERFNGVLQELMQQQSQTRQKLDQADERTIEHLTRIQTDTSAITKNQEQASAILNAMQETTSTLSETTQNIYVVAQDTNREVKSLKIDIQHYKQLLEQQEQQGIKAQNEILPMIQKFMKNNKKLHTIAIETRNGVASLKQTAQDNHIENIASQKNILNEVKEGNNLIVGAVQQGNADIKDQLKYIVDLLTNNQSSTNR